MVLLTGLTNPHTVRTAELLDVLMIIFVRGKQPSEEVLNMAEDAGIAVLMTEYTLVRRLRTALRRRSSGRNGAQKKMSEVIHEIYPVEKGAFETAGEASGTIKRMLRKLGVPSPVIRRVSVAAYEVELNLVIHSLGGQMEIDHRT